MMHYADIINKMNSLPAGRIFKLHYMTEIPIKKEFQDTWRIVKDVQTIARTGVKYKNLKGVAVNENLGSTKPSSYVHIIDNKVLYNKNTQKTYIRVARANKNNNDRVTYTIYRYGLPCQKVESLGASYSHMLAKKPTNKESVIKNIAFDHIVSIG